MLCGNSAFVEPNYQPTSVSNSGCLKKRLALIHVDYIINHTAARFRWNDWNKDHIADHGVSPEEAEFVVNHVASGFPRREGDGKYRVWGQSQRGRYLQVIYIFSPPGVTYVIHARDLEDGEKRRLRRRS